MLDAARACLERRYQAVTAVLVQVLFLNLAVAVAKMVLGYVTGAVSILSDGFHSLDRFVLQRRGAGRRAHRAQAARQRSSVRPSQVRDARRPRPSPAFLLVVMIEVGAGGLAALPPRRRTARSRALTFVVMLGDDRGEHRSWRPTSAAREQRLSSEVLLADAMHTRSDVLTSMTVIVALVGARLGYPVARSGGRARRRGVHRPRGLGDRAVHDATSSADRIVIPRGRSARGGDDACHAVMGCHDIRTRGSADYVFLDLHIWMAPEMPLDEAHAMSHEVKDRLMTRFPQIADAIIHIEPPPRRGDPRA